MKLRHPSIERWANSRKLDQIPTDWRLAKFGDLVLSSEYGLGGPSGQNGPFPFLKMNNIDWGRLDLSSCDEITVSDTDLDNHALTAGDFLFNRTNSRDLVGKACTFNKKGTFFCASYIVRFVLDKAKVCPEYLNYWWQTAIARDRLQALATPGVGQTNINPTSLQRDFFLAIAPRLEQDKIVRILARYDRAISLYEHLIAAKGDRRRALMQKLLVGKRRFPKFVRSRESRETRWGRYPIDWGYPRIGEIATPVSARNKSGSGLPVLSCTKHQGLVDSLTYFGRQVFSEDLSTYKVVKRGQFVYATNHIEEGSIGYQDLYDEALISPMYTVFETNNRVNDHFLHLVLKTELYRHIFEANTSASVDRRGSLRWNEFRKIHVPLPSLDEQDAIVSVFKSVDRELALLEQQLLSVREQKKGLMQQLLTGKRRVNVSAAA